MLHFVLFRTQVQVQARLSKNKKTLFIGYTKNRRHSTGGKTEIKLKSPNTSQGGFTGEQPEARTQTSHSGNVATEERGNNSCQYTILRQRELFPSPVSGTTLQLKEKQRSSNGNQLAASLNQRMMS